MLEMVSTHITNYIQTLEEEESGTSDAEYKSSEDAKDY